jgi:hypothetical protein
MGWKLTAGQLLDAWASYPEMRRRLKGVPPGQPIFLTGTVRSGTTWIARMLAAPGLWLVHEPFNPNKGLWDEPLSYRRPDAVDHAVDGLANRILRGGARRALDLPRTEHPLMPLRLFPQPFRRVLLKDPMACLLTAYLSERHGFRSLVVFRHPCGFVSSIVRLGWPSAGFVGKLLGCGPLIEDHLGPVVPLLREHKDKDTVESAAALHGALNLVLWNTVSRLSLTSVRFEDLCREPLEAFEALFAQLRLPYSAEVRHAHEKLCFSTSRPAGGHRAHDVERRSSEMADAWKRQLSSAEVKRIRSIWEQFRIPLYVSEAEWCEPH